MAGLAMRACTSQAWRDNRASLVIFVCVEGEIWGKMTLPEGEVSAADSRQICMEV